MHQWAIAVVQRNSRNTCSGKNENNKHALYYEEYVCFSNCDEVQNTLYFSLLSICISAYRNTPSSCRNTNTPASANKFKQSPLVRQNTGADTDAGAGASADADVHSAHLARLEESSHSMVCDGEVAADPPQEQPEEDNEGEYLSLVGGFDVPKKLKSPEQILHQKAAKAAKKRRSSARGDGDVSGSQVKWHYCATSLYQHMSIFIYQISRLIC